LAGDWYTIDAVLKPDCGLAATLSSIMTAIGCLCAKSGVAGMPSRSAYVGVGVALGLGLGDAVSDGDGSMDAVGKDEADATADGVAVEEPHACTATSSATSAIAPGSLSLPAAKLDLALLRVSTAAAQRASDASHRCGRIP
jgi:hypothetical protein